MDAMPSDMDRVIEYSQEHRIPKHVAAIKQLHGNRWNNPMYWPEPKELSQAIKIDSADLVRSREPTKECPKPYKDLLSELSREIDGYLQFPTSSIFLHGLGCVASAMCKSFYVDYGDYHLPISLYTIVSQPPSTGKSEVNRKLHAPISEAIDELNESTRTERERIKREIAGLNRRLDAASKAAESKDEPENWGDVEQILDRIHDKEKRLREIPEWNDCYTNATLQAIEMGLEDSGGMFNIVSAEADSINIAAGAAYGDKGKKTDVNLLLNAWDGEKFNGGRAGRAAYKGYVRGCVAVIAQDDTLDTMLSAGESGRGLTERFLMLSEKPKLGYRDHDIEYSFDQSIYNQYKSMIRNIVMQDKVILNFSSTANTALKNYKIDLEPTMADGGSNSHNLTTGFIGKADKQIRRIACVLHTIDHWADGGERSRTVGEDYMFRAIGIFHVLSKTFLNSADFMGYVGKNTQRDVLFEKLQVQMAKGKNKLTLNTIRGLCKSHSSFKGSRNLTDEVKQTLDSLANMNYVHIENQNVYINPRLK